MAITTNNISYSGNGPTATGQIINDGTPGDHSRALDGFGQLTLDGSATTVTLNFIDGTATLPFVPRAVFVQRNVPSTDTAAAGTTVVVSGAVTNVGIPVTISAAGSNAQLLSYAVRIVK